MHRPRRLRDAPAATDRLQNQEPARVHNRNFSLWQATSIITFTEVLFSPIVEAVPTMLILGCGGAALQLGAYGALAAGRLTSRGPALYILNVLGGVGVGLNSMTQRAWPSALLNAAWIACGVVALARLTSDQVRRPHRLLHVRWTNERSRP